MSCLINVQHLASTRQEPSSVVAAAACSNMTAVGNGNGCCAAGVQVLMRIGKLALEHAVCNNPKCAWYAHDALQHQGSHNGQVRTCTAHYVAHRLDARRGSMSYKITRCASVLHVESRPTCFLHCMAIAPSEQPPRRQGQYGYVANSPGVGLSGSLRAPRTLA